MRRQLKQDRPVQTEADLVHELVTMLHRGGYHVRTEISNMGQSVDVVATRGRWVTLIEVKVSNWRRALEQCLAHLQVADFVCVAIATVTIPPALMEAARIFGYGVLHYKRDEHMFRWALRPRLNRQVWVPQRRQWAKTVKGVSKCQLTIG